MKYKKATLFIICLVQLSLFGQNLKIKPYQFISKARDTIEAELGVFKVLEKRINGNNDSIQLSFIRFKSTNPNPRAPIVYLAGGPGGSGSETAKGKRFALFMKLREVSDVIAFDQRGTGMSERLPNCPYRSQFNLRTPVNKQKYVTEVSKTISKCLKYWKKKNVDLQAYNTTENAKDLDALRKVLGVEKMSLWGISYGSHLAFEYIRLFENNIDKLVLASLEGKDETIKLPKETENFIFKISKQAKDNYSSKVKYLNLKEKILAVHRRVKRNPIYTSYRNRKGEIDTLGISSFELQSAIATFYLKNPKDIKKLPKLYSQMYNNNFSEIVPKVIAIKKIIYNKIRPMPLAMDLQSGISKKRSKLVKEQMNTSILGSSINFLLYELMLSPLDFSILPNNFRVMQTNNVKALLLSGTMDGRTYLIDGIEIAKYFNNGKHIIIENAGHDLYMESPIINKLVLNFFKGVELNINRIVINPIVFD